MMLLSAFGLLINFQVGPSLPARASAHVQALNLAIQRALERSDFDSASAHMQNWPGEEITYSFDETLPVQFTGVDEEAARIWNTATKGRLKLVRVEAGGTVRIGTQDVVTEVDLKPVWKENVVRVRVPLSFGTDRIRATRRSAVHAIARGFGLAAGHATTERRGGAIMGIDERVEQGTELRPTQGEIETIGRILDARRVVMGLIETRTPVVPAVPKLTIEPKSANAGRIRSGATPRFDFALKNAGNAPAELAFDVTCRCLFLDAVAPIPPGQTVMIQPGLDTTGLVGRLEKAIVVHSNDPLTPVQEIILSAEALPDYRVVPDSLARVVLKDDEPTVFEILCYRLADPKMKVLGAVADKAGVSVEVIPFAGNVWDSAFGLEPTMREGYKIVVTFDSSFRAGLDWTRILIQTDVVSQPRYDVTLETHKGILAQPSAVYFGGVSSTEISQRSFKLSHAEKPFKILSMEVSGGAFETSYEPDGSGGNSYRVIVRYLGGEPGPLIGRIVIRTDHPKYSEVTVPIGGHAQ